MMSTEVSGDNNIRQRTNVQETSDSTKEETDKEIEEKIKPEPQTWKKNFSTQITTIDWLWIIVLFYFHLS